MKTGIVYDPIYLEHRIGNPKPYILFGLMLFVFMLAWISTFQTIIFFFSGTL